MLLFNSNNCAGCVDQNYVWVPWQSAFVRSKGGATRWSMVSWTMKREIQMFTVAFMVNESHSKHLNFPLHGSWDQSPPCGAAFRNPKFPMKFRGIPVPENAGSKLFTLQFRNSHLEVNVVNTTQQFAKLNFKVKIEFCVYQKSAKLIPFWSHCCSSHREIAT